MRPVLTDGEAKRFFKKDGVVTLKAENEKYPDHCLEGEFCIVGRVVGLLRKFNGQARWFQLP